MSQVQNKSEINEVSKTCINALTSFIPVISQADTFAPICHANPPGNILGQLELEEAVLEAGDNPEANLTAR